MGGKCKRVHQAEQFLAQMIKWRRWIHANPELSFQEKETANLVADVLGQIPGMVVERGIGCPTSVVGTIHSGKGPTFALRADMDALPITEKSEQLYRSQNKGVMHACGHDAHTAILLGVACMIAESFQQEGIQGSVKFIFQPAEETADEKGMSGAPYMIEAGVLDDVDGVIALHVNPQMAAGELQFHAGYSMANSDQFEAKILGTGGHGAYPHLTDDPVWMTGIVLQALYSMTGRRISPMEPAVVSVGQLHAGTASNVIPSEVVLHGTLRSYDPQTRIQLASELKKVFEMVKSLGGEYQLTMLKGEPALNNDTTITEWLMKVAGDLYPSKSLKHKPFGLAAEDFSFMTQEVPGAMFFLGCAPCDGVKRELHTPIFDIDESCLSVGAAVLAEMTIRYLKGELTNV